MNRTRSESDSRLVSRQARSRRGVAFLMLVVVLVLVVLGATHRLVQNEIQARRGLRDQIRSQTMLAAIKRASRANLDIPSDSPWTLPLGKTDNEHLEVSQGDDQSEIIVRWLRDGEVIDEMIRKVAPAPTDSERIE